MARQRILMIGLDGYEPTIAEPLLAGGQMPALAALQRDGAFLRLQHGAARRSGLAWEHVASGLAPDDARRWAAVDFDPASYAVRQLPTALTPFPAALAARTVVFDPPYFDLGAAPSVRGLVAWGAHDPGVAAASRPDGLSDEIRRRFGRYPASPWIYGFVWPSAARAREMADGLERATALRGEIAEWLLCERLPDWDLAIVVVSEFHSAVEALWHGIDERHPLHGLPSAAPARAGLEAVYRQGDRLIARLQAALPDARRVVFNLHGMGPNNSDAPSMALLAELLHRQHFGHAHHREPAWRQTTAAGLPLLAEDENWRAAMAAGFDDEDGAAAPAPAPPGLAQRLARRVLGTPAAAPRTPPSLDWMPAARYRRFWPQMPAFALPSFYDGRVRVNLAGREAQGVVTPDRYAATLDGVEALLAECRDPIGGAPVVAGVERCAQGRDPLTLARTEADLVVVWSAQAPMGFEHPTLGRIGPLPYRRTGGHTGGDGVAWFAGDGIRPGDHGTTSAFDVVPTVIDWLGEWQPGRFSGSSRLDRLCAHA